MNRLFNTLEELAMLGTAFETQDGTDGFVTVFAGEGNLATITCPDIGAGVFILTRISAGFVNYATCHFVLDDMRSNVAEVIGGMHDMLLDHSVKPCEALHIF